MPEDFSLDLDDGNRLVLEQPEGVHVPAAGSVALARHAAGHARGRTVLDLGCGSGPIALAAAKGGAREAWATDIDAAAVACARRNAARNSLSVRVEQGDLFSPVGDRRFDLIYTNPPQTPAPERAVGPKLGGPDGLRYFEQLIPQAARHLAEGGSLVTMNISLADTGRFEALLSKHFEVSLLGSLDREFTREEYDGYWPGLFDFLDERRRRGLARFSDLPDGRHAFTIRLYEARLA
jgi:release factor glutamine methyltransferase